MKPIHNMSCSYRSQADIDGIVVSLLPQLAPELKFNSLTLELNQRDKEMTLRFRNGAKRLFYISFVRKTARWLIEMGGGEPAQVLEAINICRDHFDEWFGIEPEDIQMFERRYAQEHPHTPDGDR